MHYENAELNVHIDVVVDNAKKVAEVKRILSRSFTLSPFYHTSRKTLGAGKDIITIR